MDQYLLKPDWPAPANIQAYTTLRQGGYSTGPFTSFNLSGNVGDDPNAVASNRHQLQTQLALPREPAWLRQTHSIRVVSAEDYDGLSAADASITSFPRVVCAVLTADCLPLLVCDRQGTQVAAIHAGWRGLVQGAIEACIARFTAPSEDLLVWLGPAMGPDNFLVKSDCYDRILEAFPEAAAAVQSISTEQWKVDIYCLARQRLVNCGVHHIYGGGFCTFREVDRFFSYRRDNVTGRMASLIWRI